MNKLTKENIFALISKFQLALILFWTLVVIFSITWNFYKEENTIDELTKLQAAFFFNENAPISYWKSAHKGAYVQITETTQPNPYLSHLPERDITTTTGQKLTLMTPVDMTGHLYKNKRKGKDLPIQVRLTSLTPMNPSNAPDEWEKNALMQLESGINDYSFIQKKENKIYLRLMMPLVIEKNCLRCHSKQNYRTGQIAGGISVSIPLSNLLSIIKANQETIALTHTGLWLLGLSVLFWGSKKIRKREKQILKMNNEIIEINQNLERKVKERTATLEAEIAARKKIELSLKENQEYLEKFFLLSSDGFYFIMMDEPVEWNNKIDKEKTLDYVFSHQRITKINDAMLRQFGATRKEMTNITPKDLFSYDIEKGKNFGRELFDKGRLHTETVERKLSGELMDVERDYVCLYDPNKRIIGHFGVQRDITEKKKTIEKLKKSEEKFRTLADFSYDWGYWFGPDGKFIYITPSCEIITGYSPQEFFDNPNLYLEITHPDDRDLMAKHLNELLTVPEIEPHKFDYRIISKKGKTKWIRHTCQSIYDVNRTWLGRRGSNINITERKLMEEALHQSEQRWKFALEGGAQGVWDWDIKANTIFRSRQWKIMLGYNEDEVEPTFSAWENLVHPDDYEKALAEVKKPLEDAIPYYQSENRMRCKDGSYKWILDRGFVVEWSADKKPLRIIGTHTDITPLKKAEEELRQLNLMKDRFLSIIAHDLRGPFQGLLGIASILAEDAEMTNEERMRFHKKLYEELKTQYNFLDNLLEWSRVQRGVIEFSPEPDDIAADLRETISVLQNTIEKKNLHIEFEMPEQLFFNYDKNMITTVLRNLISNAIKFTPDGGSIRISIKENENEITVSVKDTGTGIEQDNLDLLFRIDSHFSRRGTNDEDGTGLGLILCKDFVEKHKGKIWAESEAGKGSVFSFSIPRYLEEKQK